MLLINPCKHRAVWRLGGQRAQEESGGHLILVWLSLSQLHVYSSLSLSKDKIALEGTAEPSGEALLIVNPTCSSEQGAWLGGQLGMTASHNTRVQVTPLIHPKLCDKLSRQWQL